MTAITETDLQTMALTVWAEARGESREGQIAVAWVIRNRWRNPGWWSRQKGDGIPDDTITAVCRDPWQFSCWNPSDPNLFRLLSPQTLSRTDYLSILTLCRQVLDVESRTADPTGGADHYCTKAIAKHTRWAKGRKPIAVIGNHQFYRIGLEGKG
jgi:N-acetylmuramoyl-L-alanine amidase